jgi:nicotinate-nucleotide adenylyltransferase
MAKKLFGSKSSGRFSGARECYTREPDQLPEDDLSVFQEAEQAFLNTEPDEIVFPERPGTTDAEAPVEIPGDAFEEISVQEDTTDAFLDSPEEPEMTNAYIEEYAEEPEEQPARSRKDNRKQKVLSPQTRLHMTRVAAEGYAPFEVSDIEVNRPGNSYSYETLEEIAAQYQDAELFFIVGADTVCSMRTWREPGRIFAACTVLAAMREDQVDPESLLRESEALEREFGARILPVSIPNIGISSTDIRERVGRGNSIHYLVPDSLERYIIETGIYQK